MDEGGREREEVRPFYPYLVSLIPPCYSPFGNCERYGRARHEELFATWPLILDFDGKRNMEGLVAPSVIFMEANLN